MRDDTAADYRQRILRVLVYLQQHLDEDVSLSTLSQVACFSEFHFHRIFTGMIGESVKQHVRRLRLERAAGRLKATDQPVTSVAFDAGYQTHEAFTRAFGRMFGVSPSEYRDGAATNLSPQVEPIDVVIKTLEPMRVAFVRHVGPYDQVGSAWQRLMSFAGASGLFGPGMKMIGIVHDDPQITPGAKIRYDACLATTLPFEPAGEVGAQEIPSGSYAVTTHRGPYESLGTTYLRLCGQWLPRSGREAAASPPFEWYRNSPFDTAPADLLTDIHLPLD